MPIIVPLVIVTSLIPDSGYVAGVEWINRLSEIFGVDIWETYLPHFIELRDLVASGQY
ncbi:MAG: hypothetical protein LBN05_04835 [Oscillospiraceae bacterium]|nr:hypothetical protein [Oscillospiraceae bacterium]